MAIERHSFMPRIIAPLGILALSALLAGPAMTNTALAATPQPQSGDSTLNQSLENGIREAQAKRTQRDFAGAVHVLSQLMLVAPDDPRVVGEYGKVLVQQGRIAEALDFLRRAVQLQQGEWTLYSALGVAYDQSGDYASAKAAYERALVLKPGEPAVLNNYAMSRALAGDLVSARRLIGEAAVASKDERVARNLKVIGALTPLAAAAVKPAPKAALSAPPHALTQPDSKTGQTALATRTLTQAEGRAVIMQAVPVDPKAGPVAKAANAKAPHKTVVAQKPASKDGIPALRLSGDRQ
jgi:Flp pilus assembly protein TadD